MADPGPDDDVVIVEDFDDCPVRKALVAKLASALEKHPGGPASYLAAHLQNDGEKQNFVNWLWKSFPERDDVCYHHSADIPWVAEQQLAQTPPVAIHIACFGWEDGCGMKPPPGKDLTLQLVEWYLKDGFISSGEVLLVSQPQALAASSLTAPWTGDLKPCSVGYIKGRARMTALLAILHVIYSDKTGMDLTPCHKFMESVNLIWVQHLRQATKEDEVLCNLKMSLCGSLRKAANVVQMASMVRRLMQEGSTDYGSFVRRFNSQTVPAYQIRGRKATALKLLFESAPKDNFFIGFILLFSNCFKYFVAEDITHLFCRMCWMLCWTTLELWVGQIARGRRRTLAASAFFQGTSSHQDRGSGWPDSRFLMILFG